MPKQVWTVAAVMTGVLLLGLMGFGYWHRGLELSAARVEEARARAALMGAEKAAETNSLERAKLDLALAEAQRILDELRTQSEQNRQSQQTLETELRRALESKEITISQLQGKLTVDILDRILFDSGEAQLKPEGEEVLRKVAGVLAQYPERRVHVIGHTDNVPIRAGARARYPSNWELSTARALAAVRFLSEKAGVDPRRLGAVGYGEFRPLAENATPEGRAKNRRIALVVLSDELMGLDAVPAAVLPPPGLDLTNAPPVLPPAETNALPATAAPL